MAWIDVFNKITFYDATHTWPFAKLPSGATDPASIVTEVIPAHRTRILQAMEDLYIRSPTHARPLLDQAAAAGLIRIGTSPVDSPGFAAGKAGQTNAYLGLSIDTIDKLYYFNDKGVLVPEIAQLTIIHEFAHFVLGAPAADPSDDEALMNGPNFDFEGGALRLQNDVAREMGYTNNIQPSYEAFVLATDSRYTLLQTTSSYTDNNQVDVVRLGDRPGHSFRDFVNHTERTLRLNDLIITLTGNDIVLAGAGNDYVYGGAGNDSIRGGDGNDHLYGEGDDDFIRGGAGNDEMWGGLKGVDGRAEQDTASYSDAPGAITLTLGATSLSVADGQGGTDTLHSFEIVEGTIAADTLVIQSLAQATWFDYIDLDGGKDIVDIKSVPGSVTVHLTDPSNQTVQLTSGGDILHLRNAESVRVGGGDDHVHGGDIVAGLLDGGGGDNTLYLYASAGTRVDGQAGSVLMRGSGSFTFEGFGTVVGSAQPNIMITGSRISHAIGGSGVNFIEASTSGTTLESAAGDTYFSVTEGATVVSGAGNDYIEVSGTEPVTIVFGADSGHDVLEDYFQHSLDRYYERKNDTILFAGLMPGDLELVWEWRRYAGQFDFEGSSIMVGDAAIRVKSTGATLYLGELVVGHDHQTEVETQQVWMGGGYDGPGRNVMLFTLSLGFNVSFDRRGHDDSSDEYSNTVEFAIFEFADGSRKSLADLFDFKNVAPTALGADVRQALGLAGRLGEGGTPDPETGDHGAQTGSEGDDELDGTGAGEDIFSGVGDDEVDGGGGDDMVRGGGGDDLLIGGPGNDDLGGGPGIDTLDYSMTTGGVYVNMENGTAHGPGIGEDRVSSIETILGGSGNDFIVGGDAKNLLIGGTGDDIMSGNYASDRLEGGQGDDSLSGGDGDDHLLGGVGADYIEGGSGHDTIVWRPGDGSDVVLDDMAMEWVEDTLMLVGVTIAEVEFVHDFTTNDTIVRYLATGETVTIVNQLDAPGRGINWFRFTPSETASGIEYAINDQDMPWVDIYAYDLGDGDVTVVDRDWDYPAVQDRLDFGAGITRDMLIFGASADAPYDIIITFEGYSGSVRLDDAAFDPVFAPEIYNFSDGTFMTRAEVLEAYSEAISEAGTGFLYGTWQDDVLTGSAGDDLIYGNSGEDHIRGGGGNDRIYGGGDADTFYYDLGDGDDFLNDQLGGIDAIQFGPGITAQMLRFSISPEDRDDIVLSFHGHAGSILLDGAAYSDNRPFNEIRFDGGGKLTHDEVAALFLERQATAGADTINGTYLDEVINGLAGDDIIYAGDGYDDILMGPDGGFDIVDGGEGIQTRDEIIPTHDNMGIGLRSIANIYYIGQFSGTFTNVWIQGSPDADMLDFSQVQLRNITKIDGGAGDDVLLGSSDEDVIWGGEGDDSLHGNQSDDVFMVGPGHGVDSFDGGHGTDIVKAAANDVVIGISGMGGIETISANGFVNVKIRTTDAAEGWDFSANSLVGIAEIDLGGGDDSIVGSAGNDVIRGGAGDDTMYGHDGNDVFLVGPEDGFDSFNGGAGTNAIRATADNVAIGIRFMGGIQTIDANGFANVSLLTTDAGETFDFRAATLIGINEIDAGGGDDFLIGNSLTHILRGGDGDDELAAQGGDDFLYGGAGDDYITGWHGSDSYHGGAGDDDYSDEFGDDFYHYALGEGDDFIDEWDGYDVLVLGAGITTANISVSLEGEDVVFSFPDGGEVRVWYGLEPDFAVEEIRFENGTIWSLAHALSLAATDGDDTITGGIGDETLRGLGGADTISGGGGIDQLDGGAGDDVLDGGDGLDTLVGGTGDDLLTGGAGGDYYRFEAGDGNDVIREYDGTGSGGHDTVYIGASLSRTDTTVALSADGLSYILYFGGGEQSITLYGMATGAPEYQIEQIRFSPFGVYTGSSLGLRAVSVGNGNDALTGTASSNLLRGLGGDDVIDGGGDMDWLKGDGGNDHLIGGEGNDELNGGAGQDLLEGGLGDDTYIDDDLLDTIVELQGEGDDEIRTAAAAYTLPDNVERLSATTWLGQALTGNALDNHLTGWFGNDIITGGLGDDVLFGFVGDDVFRFARGDGDDRIGEHFYSSSDSGHDAIEFAAGIAPGQVTVSQSGFDIILTIDNGGGSITLVDQLHPWKGLPFDVRFDGGTVWTYAQLLEFAFTGTAGADSLTGDRDDNVVNGLGGDDLLDGGDGHDSLFGGDGDDLLHGGTSYYTDTLDGGGGNDVLIGGWRADLLTGGSGADVFRYGESFESPCYEPDRITDFVPGEDSIDLAAIDSDSNDSADQAFTFIGMNAFGGVAGELRYRFESGDTWVEGDTDGNGSADFSILLTGELPLTATDFLL